MDENTRSVEQAKADLILVRRALATYTVFSGDEHRAKQNLPSRYRTREMEDVTISVREVIQQLRCEETDLLLAIQDPRTPRSK